MRPDRKFSPWRQTVVETRRESPKKCSRKISENSKAAVTRPLIVRHVRWSPDGKTVLFVNSPAGRTDIWLQPLDGSAPKQLTNFKTQHILAFDWQPDGRSLAFVSNVETSDVVLIERKSNSPDASGLNPRSSSSFIIGKLG